MGAVKSNLFDLVLYFMKTNSCTTAFFPSGCLDSHICLQGPHYGEGDARTENRTIEDQVYLRKAAVGEQMAAVEDKRQSSDGRRNRANDLDLLTSKGVSFTEKIKHHYINPEP